MKHVKSRYRDATSDPKYLEICNQPVSVYIDRKYASFSDRQGVRNTSTCTLKLTNVTVKSVYSNLLKPSIDQGQRIRPPFNGEF